VQYKLKVNNLLANDVNIDTIHVKRFNVLFVFFWCFNVLTGSIAYSAKRQYLSYSEGDFEVYRPCCGRQVALMVHSTMPNFGAKTENFTKVLLYFGILMPHMDVSLAQFSWYLQPL